MFKPTLNKKGFECTTVDPTAKLFIKDAINQGDSWSLEIGAGFGTDTKAIIDNNIKLYCNDLDSRHLDVIKKFSGDYKNIQFLPGNFLDLKFNENTLYSIYSSRVIHFLTPKELEKAFKLFYQWLRPNGKLFITAETPYLGNWKSFIPEFEKRKKNGAKYPGFIDNPTAFENSEFAANLPPVVHWFDKETLRKIAEDNKFIVDNIMYIDRKSDFPEALLLDGRESVSAVLIKA